MDAIVKHSVCIITLNGRGAAAMVLVVVARLVLVVLLVLMGVRHAVVEGGVGGVGISRP